MVSPAGNLYIVGMTKPSPAPVPEDPETAAKRQAILEGIADADAGRVVPHDEVRRWLQSWGTGKRLPTPECK
jgi:hypothetical protein